MALQITGKIKSIGATQVIPSKTGGAPFEKRECVLDTTRFDPYTGERSEYENFPALEFTGEKCKDLDGFQPGQVVTISFELQGSFYTGQDGVEKNITRPRAYKIEARAVAHQASAPQPQAVAQPQPQAYQAPTVPPPPANGGLPW